MGSWATLAGGVTCVAGSIDGLDPPVRDCNSAKNPPLDKGAETGTGAAISAAAGTGWTGVEDTGGVDVSPMTCPETEEALRSFVMVFLNLVPDSIWPNKADLPPPPPLADVTCGLDGAGGAGGGGGILPSAAGGGGGGGGILLVSLLDTVGGVGGILTGVVKSTSSGLGDPALSGTLSKPKYMNI